MKRTLMTTSLLGLSVFAMAMASFVGVFTSTYGVSKDSALGKAGCAVCHASKSGGKLNKYGVDLKGAMGSAKKLTAAHLKAIEGKDSDGDGKSNGAEIKAGSLPGG